MNAVASGTYRSKYIRTIRVAQDFGVRTPLKLRNFPRFLTSTSTRLANSNTEYAEPQDRRKIGVNSLRVSFFYHRQGSTIQVCTVSAFPTAIYAPLLVIISIICNCDPISAEIRCQWGITAVDRETRLIALFATWYALLPSCIALPRHTRVFRRFVLSFTCL